MKHLTLRDYLDVLVILMLLSCKVSVVYGQCSSDKIDYGNGKCIPVKRKCDGQNYCGGAEPADERNCIQSVECANKEFACMDGTCIPSGQVNDGIAQCVDGDDELDTVACKPGYEPSTNGTCVDIDECKEWTLHKCSQECVNVIGGFLCSCSEGFELSNHTKCKALGSPPLFLYVHDHSIKKFNIPSNEIIVIYSNLTNPAALDIAVYDGMLFWSDITDGTIKIGSVDGSLDQTVLVDNVDSVEGIAYDWIHRNLYWTNVNNKSVSVIS